MEVKGSLDHDTKIEHGTEVGRIIHFSDAVFAIAITLLVLEIRVPEGLSPEELKDALIELWPRYLSFLISFAVIGSFWRINHLIFRHIKAYDRWLILQKLLFLLCVAFLPFSSALLGEYPDQRIAFEVYAGSTAVAGLFLTGIWWYATRDGHLTDGELEPRLVRQIMAQCLSVSVISLIIVPITFFFGVGVAVFSALALVLTWFVAERMLPRLRARSQARDDENPATTPSKRTEL